MIVISCIFRPHIIADRECWCLPRVESCTCGAGCGDVIVHRFTEVRPDSQPRMACFSEQIPLPYMG